MPSISQYGDSVYVVWWGPYDEYIWQRPRRVDVDPNVGWGTVRYLDPEPGTQSLYPQASLGRITTVWQEQFGPGVAQLLLNINNDRNVPLTDIEELHVCHIASALIDQPSNAEVKVYATWTARTREEYPQHEMLFGRYTFPLEQEFGTRDAPYYDCHTGDPIQSIYCLVRDGWARWRGYNIDYGQKHLRYRLTYLKPECIYKVRAVLYQAFRGVWEESMSIDDVPVGRFKYRSLEPETVWVTIPRELYRKDFGVDLDIGRILGDYATVAELKLYEVYPYLAKGGGKEFLPVAEPTERLLEVAGANPFRTQARIQYCVPAAQQVTLRVYDVQGRSVRDLASGPQAAGAYSLSWNGTDSRGRQVAAGAYFIELKTETTGSIRKVVYAP
jgi:hypothetical protein